MENIELLKTFLNDCEDGGELYSKYHNIDISEGMHGTQSANYNFGLKLKFGGLKYEIWGQHLTTYPNFVNKHGVMDSVSVISLVGVLPHRNYYFLSNTFKNKIASRLS